MAANYRSSHNKPLLRLDCTTPNVDKESPDSDNMIIGTVRLLYPSGEKKEMFNSTTKFNFTVSYSIQLYSMFYCAQIEL